MNDNQINEKRQAENVFGRDLGTNDYINRMNSWFSDMKSKAKKMGGVDKKGFDELTLPHKEWLDRRPTLYKDMKRENLIKGIDPSKRYFSNFSSSIESEDDEDDSDYLESDSLIGNKLKSAQLIRHGDDLYVYVNGKPTNIKISGNSDYGYDVDGETYDKLSEAKQAAADALNKVLSDFDGDLGMAFIYGGWGDDPDDDGWWK